MAKTMPVFPKDVLEKAKKDQEVVNSLVAMVAVKTISMNQALDEIRRKTDFFMDEGDIRIAVKRYKDSLKEEFA